MMFHWLYSYWFIHTIIVAIRFHFLAYRTNKKSGLYSNFVPQNSNHHSLIFSLIPKLIGWFFFLTWRANHQSLYFIDWSPPGLVNLFLFISIGGFSKWNPWQSVSLVERPECRSDSWQPVSLVKRLECRSDSYLWIHEFKNKDHFKQNFVELILVSEITNSERSL